MFIYLDNGLPGFFLFSNPTSPCSKYFFNQLLYIPLDIFSLVVISKVLNGIARRLNSAFSKEVLDRLYIRIRSNEEAFPITPSGKRDNIQLSMEGYSEKCVSVTNLLYVNSKRKGKVLTR